MKGHTQEKIRAAHIQKTKLQRKYLHVLRQEGVVSTEAKNAKSHDSADVSPNTEHHTQPQPSVLSYRERKFARKIAQTEERKSANELVQRLTQKKDARSAIAKREQSMTHRGQPRMKDRMANILQKLQKEIV